MNIFVEHIAIPAANPANLKSWYENVLGAKPVWTNGQNPLTCLIALGSVWFELYQSEAAFGIWRCVCLAWRRLRRSWKYAG